MSKFRKRPVVIEARKFNGSNRAEILAWARPELSQDALHAAQVMRLPVFIPTLEGEMKADPGDWIIKGVNGEFYPCKPDIFEKTYEPVGV